MDQQITCNNCGNVILFDELPFNMNNVDYIGRCRCSYTAYDIDIKCDYCGTVLSKEKCYSGDYPILDEVYYKSTSDEREKENKYQDEQLKRLFYGKCGIIFILILLASSIIFGALNGSCR